MTDTSTHPRGAEMTETTTPTASGADLITQERERQIREEGWTARHDAEHRNDALARAAAAYATPTRLREIRSALADGNGDRGDRWTTVPVGWPWHPDYWKPTPADRVRELVKAGALIAAEIDRLLLDPTTPR